MYPHPECTAYKIRIILIVAAIVGVILLMEYILRGY